MIRSVLLLSLLGITLPAFAQQKINYAVLDGGKYQGQELKWAASHPVQITTPYLDTSNWYVIPRAADGHYWIPCTVGV